MRTTVFLIIIFLPLTILSQITTEVSYRNEVRTFYKDIFNDSYQYTQDDFRQDSINLKIENFLINIGFDQYDDIRSRIDTIDSKYMIRQESGRVHFDTLYLKESFASYWVTLYKFLKQDSLFDIENPFSQNDIEKCISLYWDMRCKLKPSDYFSDAIFISECEIGMYYEMEGGWIDLIEKYGDYLAITLPIFNQNGDYAYFEWEYNCGNLCGSGHSAIYRKVNRKWEPYKVWNTWIR